MEEIFKSIGLEGIVTLFDRIKELLLACVEMFGKCFSWMGPELVTVLTVGIVLAITLRLLGR